MFHAGQASSVADRLVERVTGGIGTKLLAIAGAEAFDAVFVEQRLACWHQSEGFGLAGSALVGGVEPPHSFDLVAEKVEADRLALAGGKQVDDRATDRELAGIMDCIGSLVAYRLQQSDQPVTLDPLPFSKTAG